MVWSVDELSASPMDELGILTPDSKANCFLCVQQVLSTYCVNVVFEALVAIVSEGVFLLVHVMVLAPTMSVLLWKTH